MKPATCRSSTTWSASTWSRRRSLGLRLLRGHQPGLPDTRQRWTNAPHDVAHATIGGGGSEHGWRDTDNPTWWLALHQRLDVLRRTPRCPGRPRSAPALGPSARCRARPSVNTATAAPVAPSKRAVDVSQPARSASVRSAPVRSAFSEIGAPAPGRSCVRRPARAQGRHPRRSGWPGRGRRRQVRR